MATYSFANLDQWVAKTERRINAVVGDASQEVVKVMQTPKSKGGRLPVRSSTMRRSLKSQLNGGAAAVGADSYVLIAGAMKGGDVATFKYTTDYARRVNSGFTGTDALGRTYNQSGAFFVEYAVDMWPKLVAQSIAKAKAAVR